MSRTALRAFGFAMSFSVSPSFLPSAAKYSATTADSPEVEKSGLVWTSLKAPNSGLPNAAPPLPEVDSLSTSANPSFFFGQPSARAIGSHIAITSGVRTMEGAPSGVYGLSASKLRSRPHSDEAGDHATGLNVPLAIRDSASPDAALTPSTKTLRWEVLKPSISGSSSFSFSGE